MAPAWGKKQESVSIILNIPIVKLMYLALKIQEDGAVSSEVRSVGHAFCLSNRGQSEMKMCLAAKVTCRWSTQVNRRRGNKDVTDRPQMEI